MIEKDTKVIVRSNEDEPFKIGTLQGIYVSNIPYVLIDGESCLCAGIVIPHTLEMEEFLLSLSYDRQWEILSGIVLMRDHLSRGKEIKS